MTLPNTYTSGDRLLVAHADGSGDKFHATLMGEDRGAVKIHFDDWVIHVDPSLDTAPAAATLDPLSAVGYLTVISTEAGRLRNISMAKAREQGHSLRAIADAANMSAPGVQGIIDRVGQGAYNPPNGSGGNGAATDQAGQLHGGEEAGGPPSGV